MSNSDDSDDEGGNESSSIEGGFRSSRRTRNFVDSWPSQLPRRKSESYIHDSPPDEKDSNLASRYTILTFSNTHVLDDDYVLSFYGIRPYELLEIHPAGSIVRLPREVMVQYVRPYFEARVMALRAVRTDSFPSDREGLADRVAARRSKNGKIGKGRLVSSDPLVYGMFGDKNEPKKKNKKVTKTEWKERWVVIHQGVLSLCSDRLVCSFHPFLLNAPLTNFCLGSKSFHSHSTHVNHSFSWCRTFGKAFHFTRCGSTYCMC